MRHLLGAALGLLALGLLSCSESTSSDCCDEACRIWAACGWSYEACVQECTGEGDWCGSYIDCIRGKGCGQLADCE